MDRRQPGGYPETEFEEVKTQRSFNEGSLPRSGLRAHIPDFPAPLHQLDRSVLKHFHLGYKRTTLLNDRVPL
jgi:hypothetical protein